MGQRNRLRAAGRDKRFLEDTKVAARQAGVMGNRVRVLDSTPVYDAVSTQDTVTQLRSAIRKLLRALDRDHPELAAEVRARLRRDDDYASVGKPPCDWDDAEAREQLVDALVRDALAALEACEGRVLDDGVAETLRLLALVAGQDVARGDDGRFAIVRGVAPDRVISTVDTQARHGHKSRNRRFDGYKTHLSVDPESEIICAATATPANAADRDAVDELLDEPTVADTGERTREEGDGAPVVVGDAAYGDGATRARLADAGVEVMAKVPPVRNATGGFTKDRFVVDPDAGTVTCPAAHTVPIVFGRNGGGRASFGTRCATCPLRGDCTSAAGGRQITIHPQESLLQRARAEQADPDWQARYRAARPVVERKIAHYTRRLWGGRKARVRGVERVRTDVATRCGVLNLARLAVLGLHWELGGWVVEPA